MTPSQRSEEFLAGRKGDATFSPFGTSNAFTDWQRDRVTSGRRALAALNGRAAIVDGGAVRMIQKGSILADGHKVSSVRSDEHAVTLLFEDGSMERLPLDELQGLGVSQATRK